MSYRKPTTGNAMNDYFTRLRDFSQVSPKLLAAATDHQFIVWLDKCIRIDPRSTVLFLKEHRDEIPSAYMEKAKIRLGRLLVF